MIIISIIAVNFSKNRNIKQRNAQGKPWEISIKRNGITKLQTNISFIKNANIYLSNDDIDERVDGNKGGRIICPLIDELGCCNNDIVVVGLAIRCVSW